MTTTSNAPMAAIIPLLPKTSIPKRGFAVRLLAGDKDFESRVDEHDARARQRRFGVR